MRAERKRRSIEIFSLSFLDCICCGFGAIILLLVLTKFTNREYLRSRADVANLSRSEEQTHAGAGKFKPRKLQALADQLDNLSKERRALDAMLLKKRTELVTVIDEFAMQEDALQLLEDRLERTAVDEVAHSQIGDRLLAARQSLTNEMKRLLVNLPKPKNELVGGIPVDSEYVIFIIDTSGSMRRWWPLVRQKIEEALEVYPQVRGIQIMNDMGQYMFSQYRGRWIPDTPGRRQVILQMLNSWVPFSNSSPVEGIETAIRKFYSENHKISLYVFGDDFRGSGMGKVVSTVDRLNRREDMEGRRVRIHGIGFPGQQNTASGRRFATLMRVICDRNSGTFVGITVP